MLDIRVLRESLGSDIDVSDFAVWLLEFEHVPTEEVRKDRVEFLPVLPGFIDEFDEPLNHREYAAQVKSLDLKGLDSVWTAHLLQSIAHPFADLNLLANLHFVVVFHIDLEVGACNGPC